MVSILSKRIEHVLISCSCHRCFEYVPFFPSVCTFLIESSVLVLPIHLLWDVKISVRQKLGLAGIFSLGIIIVVFAVVRVIVTNAVHTHVEPTWLGVWSALESSVGKSLMVFRNPGILLASFLDLMLIASNQ
jgi:hypothetical protein